LEGYVTIGHTSMTNATNLYQHQIDFLNSKIDKTALIWSCGTGKTLTATLWAKQNEKLGTLIICPKALKRNWEIEVEKNHLLHARIFTKEQFKKEYKERPTAFNLMKQVIVDEVHSGFLTPNFKSQMSKALRHYISNRGVQRVLLLTATPYTSSPWNIFNLATYIGLNWNWAKFNYTFFDQIRMGRRMIPKAKVGSERKLAELTKKFCSVVDMKNCIDVPEQYHAEPEYFSLNKEQQNAIKNNYDPLPIVRYTLQHEIENGVLMPDEFRKLQTFETDKNERIKILVEENPKIAIVCRYNAQIDMLKDLLKEHNPVIIRGDVKDRHEITVRAEATDKCVMIIQADCGYGFNLPSFPVCVFASMSYSYTSYEQMCGRFLRMNKPSKTTFIYLLTEGKSIDQAVYDCIERKEDFSINVYDKKRS
jgi:superfamily II DNA or RNA helicase